MHILARVHPERVVFGAVGECAFALSEHMKACFCHFGVRVPNSRLEASRVGIELFHSVRLREGGWAVRLLLRWFVSIYVQGPTCSGRSQALFSVVWYC